MMSEVDNYQVWPTELWKSSPILTVCGLAFNANDHQGRSDFQIDDSVQINLILANVGYFRA